MGERESNRKEQRNQRRPKQQITPRSLATFFFFFALLPPPAKGNPAPSPTQTNQVAKEKLTFQWIGDRRSPYRSRFRLDGLRCDKAWTADCTKRLVSSTSHGMRFPLIHPLGVLGKLRSHSYSGASSLSFPIHGSPMLVLSRRLRPPAMALL